MKLAWRHRMRVRGRREVLGVSGGLVAVAAAVAAVGWLS